MYISLTYPRVWDQSFEVYFVASQSIVYPTYRKYQAQFNQELLRPSTPTKTTFEGINRVGNYHSTRTIQFLSYSNKDFTPVYRIKSRRRCLFVYSLKSDNASSQHPTALVLHSHHNFTHTTHQHRKLHLILLRSRSSEK